MLLLPINDYSMQVIQVRRKVSNLQYILQSQTPFCLHDAILMNRGIVFYSGPFTNNAYNYHPCYKSTARKAFIRQNFSVIASSSQSILSLLDWEQQPVQNVRSNFSYFVEEVCAYGRVIIIAGHQNQGLQINLYNRGLQEPNNIIEALLLFVRLLGALVTKMMAPNAQYAII